MKHALIFGTRPEIIKMSPLMRFFENSEKEYFMIHTNQHYSANMDEVFFKELVLPKPHYNLGIGSLPHGEMTGKMLIEIEKILMEEKPDVVYVQGDTNTVLAGALAASKLGIKVAHVEAGLRSYDRTMPEEINRVMTDHIASYLYAPTETQKKILEGEGIDKERIFVTGNTIVDAVLQGSELAGIHSHIIQELNIQEGEYFLATCHRPATTDIKEHLETIFEVLQDLGNRYNKEIIFPIHPRTLKMKEQFGIKTGDRIRLLEPLGFFDMLQLQKHSFAILTDSGGIQEESCILQKKCLILRENTERPEVLDVGGAILAGSTNKERILSSFEELQKREVAWSNPFGNGKSAELMIRIAEEQS